MKKLFGLVLAVAASVASYGGENGLSDYKLNVSDFNKLTVVDGVNVDYYCNPDSAGWVVFKGLPGQSAEITFNNNKENLTIQSTADEKAIENLPTVKVYSSSLSHVENSGDSLTRVFLKVPEPKFSAKQIGNGRTEVFGVDTDNFDGVVAAGKGTMKVDGKARKAKLKNVSTGTIDAVALETPELNCLVFGPGNVLCNPTKSIKVMGAGSGKIYYPHQPEKVTNRSIGVKTFEGMP